MKNNLIFICLFIFFSETVLAQSNYFPSSGNVGIGTLSPLYQLHLQASEGNRARFQFANKTVDLVSYGAGSDAYSSTQGVFMSGHDGLIMTGPNNHLRIITNNGSYTERIRVLSNGNVGIGTKVPQYLLAVNGVIGAKEVNVTTAGWADFVFDPKYKLMPLSEVEAFIAKNGHLPNIPTEKEVIEGGVNLLEMNI
ncbi:hypothetical protein [Algoriphagus marinus]|uniref:hypothetical protein n=1 Tax=Algoriphagus marinus TaxID=1925762 RepID=UPI00094B93C4|nr:hypothetical protein [Algoriphagus marinus]